MPDPTLGTAVDAPTVELVETKALGLHPVLSRLGPDLLDPDLDVAAAAARLRSSDKTVAEALLDQRLVSGIGNVYRSELLFERGQDPFASASTLTPEGALTLLETARRMLLANIDYALEEADVKEALLEHMAARLRDEGL